METDVGLSRRKTRLVLGLSLLLSSCSQDDRDATVTCNESDRLLTPVATELSTNRKESSLTGYLNSLGLSLGSIVQLTAGSNGTGTIVKWRALTLSGNDIAAASAALRSATVGEGLQVRLEDDIRIVGRRAGLDLDGDILKHTTLYIDNPIVHYLTDVAKSINRSPSIVEAIRRSKTSDLAIVSATVDGSDLRLFSTYGSTPVNTLEIGSYYVHVGYSCPSIERIGRLARRSDRAISLIIYLTRVKYDELTLQVTVDPRRLDLSPGNVAMGATP
jgi:hypothetical protein